MEIDRSILEFQSLTINMINGVFVIYLKLPSSRYLQKKPKFAGFIIFQIEEIFKLNFYKKIVKIFK